MLLLGLLSRIIQRPMVDGSNCIVGSGKVRFATALEVCLYGSVVHVEIALPLVKWCICIPGMCRSWGLPSTVPDTKASRFGTQCRTEPQTPNRTLKP